MLGNLKDFITVFQDGLASNNNIRQTLQEVQKMTNIFKDKQKVHSESKVNYGAGGELLEKYQKDWAELHANADKNAKAAEEVDKMILELLEIANLRFQSASEMANTMSYLPSLTASVAQCMDSLKTVQSLLKTVEDELVEFEDIVERNKMEKWKLDHQYHLTLYKEKKMAALEDIRCKLAKEQIEQSCDKEKRQLAELQARREQSANAFQQDVAKYLQSGSLKTGPPALPNISLEQVQLDEDTTDLDKFLDS